MVNSCLVILTVNSEDFLKIFYSGEVRELEKDLDRIKEIFKTYNLNAAFGYDEKMAVFFANHISWKVAKRQSV